MFTQQRFMGATVLGFSGSDGLGESPSQLVVSLVEDDLIDDLFTPTPVGYPATFIFNSFTYTGIVSSYGESIGTDGITFEVTLTDPREFLNGTYLILDGYTGEVYTNNLLNVYGYLESFGYGSSNRNETGLPWKYVRDTIHTLTQLPQQGTYGGPLYFLQSRYIVDLSLLPNLPDDYRVGGDSTTVLQFISEICEAGGCEYTISMVETTPGIFVIKVNVISKTAIIDYDAVTNFIASLSEYERKNVGREFANETTSKFLIGGQVREMWYQYGDLSSNTIWPFWGFDINGDPIVGTGLGNDHTFVLDSRSVNNPRVGPYYQTDVAEIRAVLGGRSNWETFLILQSSLGGIHSNKAKNIGIIGYIANKSGKELVDELINNYNASSTDPLQRKVTLDISKTFFPHTKQGWLDYEQLDIETGYLYEFLSQIANEYYGRKFMVNIPYTYSAVEPDTGKIRVSQFPVDSGFVEESQWPTAIQQNLISIEVDRFTEEDGKIVCYVRFDNGDILNLSELSPDSVGFNSVQPQYGLHKLKNYAVFVKANVDEKVIYLDPETRFGPRAIITLDGIVHERVTSDDYLSKQIVMDFVNAGFSKEGIDINSPEYKRNVLDKIVGHLAQDILNSGMPSKAVIPNLAVIPLESQVRRYGPWYAQGSPGKVEYETDESLVPWNYAGFTAMNTVAEAKVVSAIGINQQVEQGEVTFPDVPFHSLGQPILFGGPLISDISVSIDSGGAHTTYKFKRNVKQPRYGQAKAERVGQLARTGQQLRRAVRLSQLQKRRTDLSRTAKPIIIEKQKEHPKKKKTSSHEMLVGQTFTGTDGVKTTSVFLQSDYNFTSHLQHDYANKSFMSLDGIFHPYSVLPYDGLNSFTTPSIDAQSPTVDDLSPFESEITPHTKIVARDQVMPDSLYGPSTTGDYRAIALKAPLILSGWGRDTSGADVGNRYDSDTWKTGPLDTPWDEDRGVWVAGGGGTGLILGTMMSSSTAELLDGGNTVSTINWLGSTIGSGDNVFLTKRASTGGYYIVNQLYYNVGTVVSSNGCNSDGTPYQCSTSFSIPNRIGRSGPSGCPQT